MDFKKHSLKRVSSEDKQAERNHKSIFSNIIPSSSPAQDIPAQQQSIPTSSEPKVDMTALEAKIDAMEKNILLRLEKNISEQLAEALKLFQPIKSDNSEALLISIIAEMENKMVDFQKKTLLPFVQKKNEELIEIIEKERLAASEKQALKDEIIERKIKELLNDKLEGIARIFNGNIADIKKQLINDRGEEFKALLSEIKTELKFAVKNCFSDEKEVSEKNMEAISLKFAVEYKKLDKMQNTALNSMRIADNKIKGFLKKMETVIADGENSLLNRVNIENKKHLLKMKEFCASHEMFSIETISYHLDALHSKVCSIDKNLEHLGKGIDNLQFEPIIGSVGITIKKEFESLRNSLLELRNETEAFNNLRAKIGQLVVKLSETDEKHSNQ